MCACLVTQSCLTLCDPVNCSPPGSSVHRILQAGILEWVAISYSRGIFPSWGSSRPTSPASPALQADFLPAESLGKPIRCCMINAKFPSYTVPPRTALSTSEQTTAEFTRCALNGRQLCNQLLQHLRPNLGRHVRTPGPRSGRDHIFLLQTGSSAFWERIRACHCPDRL